ncbi:MAG: hypothetical protein AB8B67_00285 [Rickettsiaceae bacterium]
MIQFQKNPEFCKEEKLIHFNFFSDEFEELKAYIKDGWSIVSLVQNGDYYIGVIEKINPPLKKGSAYLPPKKNIKLSFV